MKKNFLGLIVFFFLFPGVVFASVETKEMSAFYDMIPGENNDNYVYYEDSDSNIYQYNPVTNEMKSIYTFQEKSFGSAYQNGDIIYYWFNDYEKPVVVGVNIKTGKEVYRVSVPVNRIINQSFVVDRDGYLYYNSSNYIEIYDKNGNVFDKLESSNYSSFTLKGMDPSNRILFLNIYYYNEGYVAIDENHHFVTKEISGYKRGRTPRWSFFPDGVHAINQLGEFALFDFSDVSNVTYRLLGQGIYSSSPYSKRIVVKDNFAYVSYSKTGEIYKYDLNTYKVVAKLVMAQDKRIDQIVILDDSIYGVYVENQKSYVVKANLSDFVNAKVININHHVTSNHSKEEVLNKYNSSLYTFDYSKSIYTSEPNYNAPYYEGILNNSVKQDVLRQFNFYRWVSGLNEVTINEDKMPRSMKGGLILKVLDTLTHYPSQPSGMSDDFYNEAYKGVNAGSTEGDQYSGNASYNTPIYNLVRGFVDDSSNLMAGVGHRSSMLDPYAKSISFGYAKPYGAMSVYYDNTNLNSEAFYPWPPAGYLPVESFPANARTRWSVWIGDFIPTNDLKITMEHGGTSYDVYGIHVEDNTIDFPVPSALQEKIIRKNGQYMTNQPIKVTIRNLNSSIDTVNLSYETTFIQAKEIPIESMSFMTSKTKQVYSVIQDGEKINLNLGEKMYFGVTYKPLNATIDKIVLKSSDESILKFDEETQEILMFKGGDVTISVGEPKFGIVKSYSVHVNAPSTGVQIVEKSPTVLVGKTIDLHAKLLPDGATDKAEFTWSSSNPSVATIEKSGKVTALKAGTTTITAKSSKGFTASTVLNVLKYQKGDMDQDGDVDILDVMVALRIHFGITKSNSIYVSIGDMNENGKVDIVDVLGILRMALKVS